VQLDLIKKKLNLIENNMIKITQQAHIFLSVLRMKRRRKKWVKYL